MSGAIVVAAVLAAAAVVGVTAYLALRHWPAHDPSLPAPPSGSTRAVLRRLQRGHSAPAATGAGLAVVGLVVASGAVSVGVLHVMVREGWGIAPADPPVAEWASQHATSWSTTVLDAVTALGSTVFLATAVLATLAYERARARRPTGAAFLLTVAAGQWAVTNVVKWAVDRARPEIDPLGSFSGPSFPSGHSAGAAAVLAGIALVVGRGLVRQRRDLLLAAAAAVAAAVAATRVLLGVHWLTDVLAGLALGWTWFFACALAFGGVRLHFGTPAEQAAGPGTGSAAPPERRGGVPPDR